MHLGELKIETLRTASTAQPMESAAIKPDELMQLKSMSMEFFSFTGALCDMFEVQAVQQATFQS